MKNLYSQLLAFLSIFHQGAKSPCITNTKIMQGGNKSKEVQMFFTRARCRAGQEALRDRY